MAMNIGDPVRYGEADYQKELARHDVVVLNFWPEWQHWKYGPGGMRRVVREIKSLNPSILIGQYTNLNEARDADDPDNSQPDLARKLDAEGWWLLGADRTRRRWSDAYGNFDINVTRWSAADASGRRYPEWYAYRSYRTFFAHVPEFDFWYLDNSLTVSPVASADWDRDGVDERATDTDVMNAYRAGHVAFWRTIRQLQPGALLIANTDDPSVEAYKGQLDGVFMEAVIGRTWSTEERRGWQGMMSRYRAAIASVRERAVVGFGVVGGRQDYQRLRFALASCLLDDGYFSYSNSEAGGDYAGVLWFDEFDAALGYPQDGPVTVRDASGLYRRRFTGGLVLVNPSAAPLPFKVPPGYRRLRGRQDPDVNNGMRITQGWLAGRDGLILVRDSQ